MAEERRIPIILELRDKASRALQAFRQRLERTVDATLAFQNRLRETNRKIGKITTSATKGVQATVDKVVQNLQVQGSELAAVTDQNVSIWSKLGAVFNRAAFFARRTAWALTWMQLSFLGFWFQARYFIRTVETPFKRLLDLFRGWSKALGDVAFAFGLASYYGISLGMSMGEFGGVLEDLVNLGLQTQMIFGLFTLALVLVGREIFRSVIPAIAQLLVKLIQLLQTEKVRKMLQELAAGFVSFIRKLGALIDRLPELIEAFRQLWAMIVPFVRLIGWLTQSFINLLPLPQALKDALTTLISPLVHANGSLKSLGAVLASVATILTMIGPLFMMLMMVLNMITIPILTVANLLDLLGGILSFLGVSSISLSGIIEGLAGILGGLAGVAESAGGAIVGALAAIPTPITIAIAAIAAFAIAYQLNLFGIRDKTNAFLAWLKGALQNLAGQIQGFFTWLGEQALTWGIEFIRHYVQGILSVADWVKDAVGTVVDTIKNFLGFGSLPRLGELRRIPEWGAGMAREFTRGFYSELGGFSFHMTPPGTSLTYVTVNFTGEIRSEADIERVADELARRITDRLRQRGGMRW